VLAKQLMPNFHLARHKQSNLKVPIKMKWKKNEKMSVGLTKESSFCWFVPLSNCVDWLISMYLNISTIILKGL